MKKGHSARDLVAEGLESWEHGNLVEAEAKYRQALEHACEGQHVLADIHEALGTLLQQRGRVSEAREHFEKALVAAQATGASEASLDIVTIRYFLANHYLVVGLPDAALRTVEPSIDAGARSPLPRVIQAEAFAALGDVGRAKGAAIQALELSRTEDQRKRIREGLAKVLME